MPGEDFESIALGLNVRQQKKVVQPNQHVPLTAAEMAILSQAPQSSLYAVLLKIMEGVSEKLETEHMRCWKDKDLFDRTGVLAVAAQIYFEAIQREILYQVNEYNGQVDMLAIDQEASQMTPQDFINKSFGIDIKK